MWWHLVSLVSRGSQDSGVVLPNTEQTLGLLTGLTFVPSTGPEVRTWQQYIVIFSCLLFNILNFIWLCSLPWSANLNRDKLIVEQKVCWMLKLMASISWTRLWSRLCSESSFWTVRYGLPPQSFSTGLKLQRSHTSSLIHLKLTLCKSVGITAFFSIINAGKFRDLAYPFFIFSFTFSITITCIGSKSEVATQC